jgi:gag-polyprotein putative aspartyl protease
VPNREFEVVVRSLLGRWTEVLTALFPGDDMVQFPSGQTLAINRVETVGITARRHHGGSAVRRALAATVLLTLALSVKATYLMALTAGQTGATRVAMNEIAGHEVVRVSINGTGPYDFILDTGSNVTIVRSELIRKLHCPRGEPMATISATGETHGQLVIVESIAVAGLAVEHLEVNALDPVRALTGRVQRILGENFLRRHCCRHIPKI